MKPIVSIVIPTWQREQLVLDTLTNIGKQTFEQKNIEVIVVSDGVDNALHKAMLLINQMTPFRIRYISLGTNWSSLQPSSFGIAPLLVGYLAAEGTYVMHLSDDDRIAPDYIEKLVCLLEETNADFAYSKTRFFWHDQKPEDGEDIGTDPPQHGQITSYLFRPENLYRFGYPRWKSHPVDWSLISDWMLNGATWAFLPEVLFWHCANDESGRNK